MSERSEHKLCLQSWSGVVKLVIKLMVCLHLIVQSACLLKAHRNNTGDIKQGHNVSICANLFRGFGWQLPLKLLLQVVLLLHQA